MKGDKGILDEDEADNTLLATIPGMLTDDILRSLENGLQAGGRYLREDALFGERWGIFWASAPDRRSDEVEETWRRQYPVDPLACRLRDWLGLVHYSKEAALFEFTIRYGGTGAAAPTFVEAQDHSRFKAASDPSSEGWGIATDLSKLNPPQGDIDGGREIVSKATSVTNVATCRWLGFPKVDDNSSHDEFVRHLLGPKSWDSIVNELGLL
jgi:hypothetical protein